MEEVDPCEDLTDDDLRTAIHNATGPRSALFVPDVPFEVLIRSKIARLFIGYHEVIKMSHRCMVHELQRFCRFLESESMMLLGIFFDMVFNLLR